MSSEALARRPGTAYVAAYTAIGAAIYYMLLFLPGVPIIGTPGKMEIGAALSPVFGVLLGPMLGFGAVLIGNTLKFLTTPSIYSLPFIPAAPLSALAAGFLAEKKWSVPVVIMVAMLIAAVLAPPFYPLTDYWYVYLVAFYDKIAALILVPVSVWLLRRKVRARYYYVALYMLMFISREFDKAFGCAVFAFPQVYQGVFGITKVSAVRKLYLVSPLYYLAGYIVEGLVAFAVALTLVEAVARVPGLAENLHVRHLYKRE
ncbi:MAG: ECF transporter S component [Thermofilum sp.]|jgi:hypothetical protein|nr:ECF transporter S component [Thermofilum sp.]